MGGFYIVVAAMARDIIKTLERHNAGDDELYEVRKRLNKLLEMSMSDLDVRRTATQLSSSEVVSSVMKDFTDTLFNEEIPRIQLEHAECICGKLASELQAERKLRDDAESRERVYCEKLKRMEEAHKMMMNSLFRELLYLRRALRISGEEKDRRSSGRCSPFPREKSGMFAELSIPTLGSVRFSSNFERVASSSSMMEKRNTIPNLTSMASSSQLEGAPCAPSMEHGVWTREDYKHNTGALFDYQAYVTTVNADIAEFPARLEALRSELKKHTSETNAERSRLTSKHNAIVRQKDAQIDQSVSDIAALSRKHENFIDAFHWAIAEVRRDLTLSLRGIRDEFAAMKGEVSSWLLSIASNLEAAERRQFVLLQFFSSCTAQLQRELDSLKRGNVTKPLTTNTFSQFFSVKGVESQQEVEANSYWRSNEQMRKLISSWQRIPQQLTELCASGGTKGRSGSNLPALQPRLLGQDDVSEVSAGPRTVVVGARTPYISPTRGSRGSVNISPEPLWAPEGSKPVDKFPDSQITVSKSSAPHPAIVDVPHELRDDSPSNLPGDEPENLEATLEGGVDVWIPPVEQVQPVASTQKWVERQVPQKAILSFVPERMSSRHGQRLTFINSSDGTDKPRCANETKTVAVPLSVMQCRELMQRTPQKPPEVIGHGVSPSKSSPKKTGLNLMDLPQPHLLPSHVPKSHAAHQVLAPSLRTVEIAVADSFLVDKDRANFFQVRSMQTADSSGSHVPTLPVSPPDVNRQSRELLLRSRRYAAD